MSRIFISYARENQAFVEALYQPLQRVYQHIWYDQGLVAGEHWWPTIQQEITNCEIFVIILSEYWKQSEYGRKEYDLAEQQNKKILPIRIDNSEAPQFLSAIQYVDIQSDQLNINNLTEIHAAIVRLTDEIVREQQQYASSLRRGFIGVGIIGLVLLATIIGIITTQLPPFPGEISYISPNGVNYEIRLISGGLPGLFRNIISPGPSSLPGTAVAEDSKFAISPDGNKIAFASRLRGNQDIYVADRDGSNVVQLTANMGDNNSPSWSSDGSQLVFASNRDGNWEIYRMDADGSEPQNLTNNPSDDEQPDWSPSGALIAFVSNRDGNREIYRMNADGSAPRNVTDDPADDRQPDWSPDGQNIAFASNRDVSSASPLDDLGLGESTANICDPVTYDIYITDANGINLRWLVQGRDADDRAPSWSPDGDFIVFSSDRRGDYDLYFVHVTDDSFTPILLTEDGFEDDYFPLWRS